jgi:hypothetical protein
MSGQYGLQPRWLSPQATATYLSVRVDALPRLVRQGRLPKPDYSLGPRSPRYDREAIDRMMGVKTSRQSIDDAVARAIASIKARGPYRKKRLKDGTIGD